MSKIPAFLLQDDRIALTEPPADLIAPIRGKISERLSDLLSEIITKETGWALWQSSSSVDAGAWFVFPKCLILCTEQSVHLLADAPSWLGGNLVHRFVEFQTIQRVCYNDVTADLVLQLDSPDKEWPALQLDPIDGHQAVLLIERLIK